MYKKIIIIIALVLLTGCTKNEEVNSTGFESDGTYNEIEILKQKNEEVKSRLDQLISEIEEKNSEIDDLKNRIHNLEVDQYSFYSKSYTDYMISFSYDVVRELDGFSSHSGIITKYDSELEFIEVVPVEIVYVNDLERIKELKIDTEETPRHGDVYMFSNYDEKTSYKLSKNFELFIYDWEGSGQLMSKSLESELEDTAEYDKIYIFSLVKDKIIRITENYIN